jgi:hypothetical protein
MGGYTVEQVDVLPVLRCQKWFTLLSQLWLAKPPNVHVLANL